MEGVSSVKFFVLFFHMRIIRTEGFGFAASLSHDKWRHEKRERKKKGEKGEGSFQCVLELRS